VRDPAELVHEATLPFSATGDVLDDRVGEADLEGRVEEGKVSAVRLHDGHLRERGGETVETSVSDCGQAIGPWVERLEEIVRRPASERRVGDTDVEHRRLRARLKQLEEALQLPLAAPQ
jgi:hypothetical protein